MPDGPEDTNLSGMPCKSAARVALAFLPPSLFIILGLVIVSWLPPFQVPDEPVHWMAAYQRAERLLSRLGGREAVTCSPAMSLPGIFRVGQIAFQPNKAVPRQRFDEAVNAGVHCSDPVVPYGSVFSYPGVLIARVLIRSENDSGAGALLVFYLARLFQGLLVALLLFRLGFLWCTSAHPPFGVLMLFAAALSPLLLQQSFSVSADAIASMAIISGISWLAFWRDVKWFDALALIFLSAAAVTTKPPLLPLILVCVAGGCALGWYSGQADRDRVRLGTGIFVIVLCVCLAAWISVVHRSHHPETFQSHGQRMNPAKQIEYVRDNPLRVWGILHQNLMSYMSVEGMSGPLGWLDTKLSPRTVSGFKSLLVAAGGTELLLLVLTLPLLPRSKMEWKRVCMAMVVYGLLVLSAYGTALLSSLAMYIYWTGVGAGSVLGVQARYFFPSVFACIIALGGSVCALLTSSKGRIRWSRAASYVAFLGAVLIVLHAIMLSAYLWLDLAVRYW